VLVPAISNCAQPCREDMSAKRKIKYERCDCVDFILTQVNDL